MVRNCFELFLSNPVHTAAAHGGEYQTQPAGFFVDTGTLLREALTFCECLASEWRINVIDLCRDPRWDDFVLGNIRILPADDPAVALISSQGPAHAKSAAGCTGVDLRDSPRADCHTREGKDIGISGRQLVEGQPAVELDKGGCDPACAGVQLVIPSKGYRSVDCTPCTIAVGVIEDECAGHWAGRNKVECGLHTVMFTKKYISEL